MKPHAKALGKTVHAYRIRLRMSQEDLALRMGSTQATVSRMENGRGECTLEKVIDAAESLGIVITIKAGLPALRKE